MYRELLSCTVIALGACAYESPSEVGADSQARLAQEGDYALFVAEGGTGDGSAGDPYGTIGDALADVAAFRPEGSRAVIHIGAGTFEERLTLVPGSHDDLVLRGSTRFLFDGRDRPVHTQGTLGRQGSDTIVTFDTGGAATDQWVIYVAASGVTLQNLAVRATSTHGPQAAVTFDGARQAAVHQVAVTGAFLGLHARGSELAIDQLLSRGNRVGISLEGGLPGSAGDYVMTRSRSENNLGHGLQLVSNFDRTFPTFVDGFLANTTRRVLEDWTPVEADGLEEATVFIDDFAAENNCWTEFNVKGNLPAFDIAPSGAFTTLHISRFYNPGRLTVAIQDSEAAADHDGLLELCVPDWGPSYLPEDHRGVGIDPDNYGYSNHGCTAESMQAGTCAAHAAASHIDLTVEDLELSYEGPIAPAGANLYGAPHMTVDVTDDGGALSILATDAGHDGIVAPSTLTYNGDPVGP